MTLEDLLKEASDPSTDPERLGELAYHENKAAQRAAWMNPSLPEDVWREVLLGYEPEAWANPMAPFYLLTWTSRKEDRTTMEGAARFVMSELFRNDDRCSPEGKALIAAKVQEWWVTAQSADDMMTYLGWWAEAKGKDSFEHRETVRILVLCVRTAPDLIAKDRQALDLLDTWSGGGQDLRKKATALASSRAVTYACQFAHNTWSNAWYATSEVIKAASSPEKVDHLLTDLIRQEMPLPPVVA
jgi:hypothetical protein